jgi:hypothetical protein
MVSRRTLLLFNFGAGLTFLVMGLLSPHVIAVLFPSLGEVIVLPTMSPTARLDMATTQNIEHLRAQGLFFFDLAMDLKRALADAEGREIDAVRYACFLLAALAGVGGMLVLALKDAVKPAPPAR